MKDDLTLTPRPAATDDAPLRGLTILLVDDSRFASEAVRLMCLRSGARIRRADCLRAARRHLAAYRPAAVIIDMGLPDGSGAALIAELHRATPRLPAIIGTSGLLDAAQEALAAGADGFLAKPILSLAGFQAAVLGPLKGGATAPALRLVGNDLPEPDPIALRDDLVMADHILSNRPAADDGAWARLGYVTDFLAGVGQASRDEALSDAARRAATGLRSAAFAARARTAGDIDLPDIGHLRGIVQDRLAMRASL